MSTTGSSERIGFQVRGWHVWAGVAAFFAVVIAVDATFTVLALRTFPGQVSVTPYEDGLLYNRRIGGHKDTHRTNLVRGNDRSDGTSSGLARAAQPRARDALEAHLDCLRVERAVGDLQRLAVAHRPIVQAHERRGAVAQRV